MVTHGVDEVSNRALISDCRRLTMCVFSDLSQHVVSDCKQAMELLEEGIANRMTAATHNHDASSRSHAIFTIQYTQVIICPAHSSNSASLILV